MELLRGLVTAHADVGGGRWSHFLQIPDRVEPGIFFVPLGRGMERAGTVTRLARHVGPGLVSIDDGVVVGIVRPVFRLVVTGRAAFGADVGRMRGGGGWRRCIGGWRCGGGLCRDRCGEETAGRENGG